MVESQAVNFAEAAQTLSGKARSLGLATPVFKSPPSMLGVSRTVRRRKGGQVIVAIAFRNRPWHAVLADMIDGILHINELQGTAASRARDDLWETFSEVTKAAA